MNLALVIFELVVMLLAISLHDCAQAWMANRLGDATARLSGRMTINPIPHFDFFGTALWPLLYVWRSPLILGWGKPIPILTRNFRHPRDEVKAVLAGPAAQFGAALLCLLALVVVKHTSPGAASTFGVAEALSLRNLDVPTEGLPGIFPLLLFFYYLPYNAARAYERYGLLLMFGFMFFGFGLVLAVFIPLLTSFNGLLYAL